VSLWALRLEHQQECPKVNMWCALTHESIIGLYFFDEDIITSNSFLHMLENYALPQLNSKNNLTILQLDETPLHFSHIVHDCWDVSFSC
jgi:hypothetical protein